MNIRVRWKLLGGHVRFALFYNGLMGELALTKEEFVIYKRVHERCGYTFIEET